MAHVPAEQRRKQLVAAAIDVIADVGLSKATTRAITGRAGVPLAVMHYCFRDKAALLESVATEVVERTYPWIERVEVNQGLAMAIRSVTHELWDWLYREPKLQLALMEMLVWRVRHESGDSAAAPSLKIDFFYQRTFEILCAPLDRAAELAGETTEVGLMEVVRTLAAGVDGLFMQYLSVGELSAVVEPLQSLAEAAVRLAGVRPRGEL